jgi:hypothetical protein
MHCKSVKISIGLPVVCWVFGDYNFTTGCPFIHSFFGEGIGSTKGIDNDKKNVTQKISRRKRIIG